MATYSLIIKNIINTENTIFSVNYKPDGIDNNLKIIFTIFLTKKINILNKYIFFNETLESFLIKNIKENEFINYFCKIQKVYNVLNKLIYLYKYKKAKIIVNTDMGLNNLNINGKNVICVFHNNSKYLFHSNDLINIINSSLTYSQYFFCQPQNIKNPYNNIPFNKSTLYNIYFFIRYKTDYYPELFFKFFKLDFNLSLFKKKYEKILINYSINNFVYKSPANILVDEINDMIDYFNTQCRIQRLKNKISIDADFPKNKLIKIMRPYLLMYIAAEHVYIQYSRSNTFFLFEKSLLMFNIFNPQFGKKKYKFLKKNTNDFNTYIYEKIIEFDERHIPFYNKCKNNFLFLTDHLSYEEDDS